MRATLAILTAGRRLVIAALLVCYAAPAWAISIIRDAETEAVIRQIADPIFKAARLDPDSIDIYIVNDPKLNAFVAGGQNLFINTGLMIRTTDPDELAGVIAHETGHIAGGHLSRNAQAQQSAGLSTIAGFLLGAAAAVAGAPQLGTALIAGGATVAQSGYLKFTRWQEEAADQAAATYLKALKMSPQGLLDFFHVLDAQNLHIDGQGNEFLMSHPLTSERIVFLEGQVAQSPYRDAKPDPALVAAYARVVAKLDGFLSPVDQVLKNRSSDSVPDRYARAVAYYRIPDLPRALDLTDGLIKQYPKDPYFWELKGQILFENGKVAESIDPYREALRNRPSSALLRLGLARSLMENQNAKDLEEAAALLRDVTRVEPQNGDAWRFLGIAEGQLGREGQSALALAEQAVLAGNKKNAELYINRAGRFIKEQDPDWYQLQDLTREAANLPSRSGGRLDAGG